MSARLGGKHQARIVEVFSSLQGEGPRLGERQIFVRFAGCNLRCDYCDEPGALAASAGRKWSAERLREKIDSLARERRHRTISWTGGEPLLHAAFLRGMLRWARTRGFANYLETNGVLARPFADVARWVDAAAVDLKLPSATGRAAWARHARFLRAAPPGSFVKVVLTQASSDKEWERVLGFLEKHAPKLPLILQPATHIRSGFPGGGFALPIPPARAVRFLLRARRRLGNARIIPQWHPVWRLR